VAEFRITHGLKTEYSENFGGSWDDSDRYLIVTVRAETKDGALKKAEAFHVADGTWDSGYVVVGVENLDADPD
jgi:hypothetical protein